MSTDHHDVPAPTLPAAPIDVRLVAVDMDGTLLDADGEVPAGFWPLLEEMTRRGIVLVPASGRQYATLRDVFGDTAAGMGFIAENGTLVAYRGEVLATDTLPREIVTDVVATVRELAAHRNLGVVVCGVSSAYIERTDAPFRAEVDTYYHALAEVDDLLTVEEDVLKCALFDFDDAEHGVYPHLSRFSDSQVVVSGRHWIDIMNPTVHKGSGLERLTELLGLRREQTVAFGDYLNDLQLLQAAGTSFAMANAHPDIIAVADHVAPSHVEQGVITVLRSLLSPKP
ncbi:MAG: Cof-type HAD-IIB family hydrolase [Mobilicoccus sp.]|nr:Cof-type HAD-IIB family hydrolase [Mobilicoccus sp.]